MRILGTTISVLALSATVAGAGELDRSGQGIGVIFKDGNWAELSFGNVNPSVSGTYTLIPGTVSGDMAPSYNQIGVGLKYAVNSALDVALIFDQPWGASVDYSNATFPIAGTTVSLQSRGITALARYKLNDNISVYGGVRQNTLTEIEVTLAARPAPPAAAYSASGAQSSAIGYVLGAAYEIPDIALRAAITYSSGTSHDVVITESGAGVSTTNIKMPQSVNVELQTGIAADTLLTASMRWVDWSETVIDPAGHRAQRLTALQTYSEDTYTWSLGVGRRFSESLAGSATIGWERPQGGNSGDLSPTDGNVSLALGVAYTMDNMEIRGGVRYVKLGDATTATTGTFTNNSVVALGMSVGFAF